jgi:uncharacterized phage protein (TIGR01671 family)
VKKVFRGQSVKTGRWLYGDFVLKGDYVFEKSERKHYILSMQDVNAENRDTTIIKCTIFVPKNSKDELGLREVIPDTVSKNAGQKDKNGTAIFEGDILKSIYPEHGYKALVSVEFNGDDFGVKTKDQWGEELFIAFGDGIEAKNFIVIGNKWQIATMESVD